MSTTKLAPGTLVKIVGVKTPVLVVEKLFEGQSLRSYSVSGPRGDFTICDCGSHWVRGAMRRGAFERPIEIEWTKAPVEVA